MGHLQQSYFEYYSYADDDMNIQVDLYHEFVNQMNSAFHLLQKYFL